MKKNILLILGIILTTLGIFFNIIYLNVLILGYSFLEYVQFISRRIEFYFFIIGVIILVFNFKRKE